MFSGPWGSTSRIINRGTPALQPDDGSNAGFKETNFEFEVEMIVVCIQRGYQLAWVPIRTIYGDEEPYPSAAAHLSLHEFVLQARQAIAEQKTQPMTDILNT